MGDERLSEHVLSSGQMSPTRQMLLAIASGLILALAFPPLNFTPAAFVALVPLFHAMSGERRRGFWPGFRLGLVAGIAFFAVLLHWLIFLSSAEVNSPRLMMGALTLLVLLQSLFWGLFSALGVFVIRRTRIPRYVALPVLWVAFEQLRSLGVLGFTWGAVGYAAVPAPMTIQFVSVTGMFGASLWIVLFNTLVLELGSADRGKPRRVLGYAIALAAVFVAPIIHGAFVMRHANWDRFAKVAVVQPNIPGEIKWDAAYKSASFDALESLTLDAAVERPELIVWPETAAPSYLLRERSDLTRVQAIARLSRSAILTGFPDIWMGEEDTGRPVNSALLIDAEGTPVATYDKMKLVPFGEIVPFQTVIPLLRGVDLGQANFLPGTKLVVFELPQVRFSVLICYEATFPRLVRRFADSGAELLVNITNDVWYGRSAMPYQHAQMAIMRCIENRRSMARSANTGVSMLVDPCGRVLQRTAIFEQAVLVGELPIVKERTFYARRGDVFPWAMAILGALMVAAGVHFEPRRRLQRAPRS